MSKRFKLNPNEKFDDETVELYRIRETSDDAQIKMKRMERGYSRNFLPIITKIDPKREGELEGWIRQRPFIAASYVGFGIFATWQWCKTFFPYGYVLRASVPQSWGTYCKQRLPLVIFMTSLWYLTRYKRIQALPDLTCDSERA